MIFDVPLALVCFALIALYVYEVRAARAERRDFLNRLMVKNWSEYKALQPEAPSGAVRQVLTEEDEAKWWAEQRSKVEKEFPGMRDEIEKDFAEAMAVNN